jgi:hypothetical protein
MVIFINSLFVGRQFFNSVIIKRFHGHIILLKNIINSIGTTEIDKINTSASELEITFIGHGTLMLTFGGKIIHIDPTKMFPRQPSPWQSWQLGGPLPYDRLRLWHVLQTP